MIVAANPDQKRWLDEAKARLESGAVFTARYDNGPVREEVGDQYISTFRIMRDLPKDAVVFG